MKQRVTKLSLALLLSTSLSTHLYAAEHEVKMLNSGKNGAIMVFDPGALKVEVGDTVKFIPTDSGHNVVSNFTPEGAATWKGEIGKEVTVTIDKEGLYIYTCEPHKTMGMAGVIQAGEAINKEAATKAIKELSATFVMNNDRLDKYLEELSSAKDGSKDSEEKSSEGDSEGDKKVIEEKKEAVEVK